MPKVGVVFGDIGEVAAVTRLAEGASLREVLDLAGPDDWIALDAAVRRFDMLRPAEPRGESELVLALCHRDGRVRQSPTQARSRNPRLSPPGWRASGAGHSVLGRTPADALRGCPARLDVGAHLFSRCVPAQHEQDAGIPG